MILEGLKEIINAGHRENQDKFDKDSVIGELSSYIMDQVIRDIEEFITYAKDGLLKQGMQFTFECPIDIIKYGADGKHSIDKTVKVEIWDNESDMVKGNVYFNIVYYNSKEENGKLSNENLLSIPEITLFVNDRAMAIENVYDYYQNILSHELYHLYQMIKQGEHEKFQLPTGNKRRNRIKRVKELLKTELKATDKEADKMIYISSPEEMEIFIHEMFRDIKKIILNGDMPDEFFNVSRFNELYKILIRLSYSNYSMFSYLFLFRKKTFHDKDISYLRKKFVGYFYETITGLMNSPEIVNYLNTISDRLTNENSYIMNLITKENKKIIFNK